MLTHLFAIVLFIIRKRGLPRRKRRKKPDRIAVALFFASQKPTAMDKKRTEINPTRSIKRGANGMAKAMSIGMNYYEKLAMKVSQSMKANPHSAIVMDMNSFEVIARGKNIGSLSKKMTAIPAGVSTVVFQKPNQAAAWIL